MISPLVIKLKENLDDWPLENECVKALEPYAANIPNELINDYVSAITLTYIGYMGGSAQWSRRDFFANGAAPIIPKMFQVFDDNAANSFVDTIKHSETLRRRIESPAKLERLRSLANIVLERISSSFGEKEFLENLVDQSKAGEFFKQIQI